jgi:hypothetical protein
MADPKSFYRPVLYQVGNEIVVANLEPDGAAAACGLLSLGDALDEVSWDHSCVCPHILCFVERMWSARGRRVERVWV